MEALIRAAERGKQVAALVELKARFDEAANIGWARALEEAGVHVVYGLVGLKTHSKMRTGRAPRARRHAPLLPHRHRQLQPQDRPDVRGHRAADRRSRIGADVTELFNFLTGYSRQMRLPQDARRAASRCASGIMTLIEHETALRSADGRIVMKMNSLVDPAMIDALYGASAAGVQIDLIIRGICCLRPGVPGLSENIRVRSIVGRFLEHSRMYYFANGAGDGQAVFYIGSADLMPRNLDRRVEVVVPVDDPDLQDRLREVLEVNLADDTLAWRLVADGSWERVRTSASNGVDTHRRLRELVLEQARRSIAGE